MRFQGLALRKENLGKADLHIHSSVSDGMASVREIMAHAGENTDLDLIAIADHDAVDGSLEALEWVESHPGSRTKAVFATEITATLGRHLLAYFFQPPYPTRPFPQLRSYRQTIASIHEMGGMAAIPHPTVIWTPSGGYRQIRWLLENGVVIDGLEVCNAAIGVRGNEGKLRRFNKGHFRLAELGGSDAHHLAQIGSGYSLFKGHTPGDFREAFSRRETKACWGSAGAVSWREHVKQVFKSWIDKPTRRIRSPLTNFQPLLSALKKGPE